MPSRFPDTINDKGITTMKAFKAFLFAGLAGLPLAAMPAMAQSAPQGVAGSTGKTDQAATAEAKATADMNAPAAPGTPRLGQRKTAGDGAEGGGAK